MTEEGNEAATLRLSVEVRFAGATPKAGSAPAECEDAFAVAENAPGSPIALRAAVADGASDSVYAGEWAALLAREFAAAGPGAWDDAVRRAAMEWRAMADSRPLPWHAEPKRARGAFAALVGIEVRRDGRWSAASVGDSCAFVVRGGQVAVAFPFRAAADFPALPLLLGTNETVGETGTTPPPARTSGMAEPGDDIFLMSDALAAWFLDDAAEGREPWRWLADLGERRDPVHELADRIHVLREMGRLRNDDVALIHLRCALLPAAKMAEAV